MVQTHPYSAQSSFPLPDVFSSSLTEIFDRVQPGIVQVITEGHGGGTGIIWQANGSILTNNHVVSRNESKIKVLLSDGRTFEAQVERRNPQLDLALLKVDGENLSPLEIGDSARLRIGEWVFAIGHPWGQRWVVTAGIVSSLSSVKIAENLTTQYIKSDVQLAPGNSGGPLLDSEGKVVGINAMIFGGDLAVAIPGNVVSTWLAEGPASKHPLKLGIEIQTVELPEQIRSSLALPQSGVLVVGIQSVRQEKYNDLLIGDILLEVAHTQVPDTATLHRILTQSEKKPALAMRILRGGVVQVLDVSVLTME